MKSKVWINALLLFFIISCNGQSDKKKEEKSVNTSTNTTKKVNSEKKVNLADIKVGTAIDKTLGIWGMSLADDSNETTNLNLDYEEFILNSKIPTQFFTVDLTDKFREGSIFYDKSNKTIFSYEIKVTNSQAADELIKSFKDKFGKPTFFKAQDTKAGTIFFDENGNEVENMKQNFYKWNDASSHTAFFLVEKKGAQTELNIIAIDSSSKRFKEWTSFRSLGLVFPLNN